jgi:EH domain-containing protein 1
MLRNCVGHPHDRSEYVVVETAQLSPKCSLYLVFLKYHQPLAGYSSWFAIADADSDGRVTNVEGPPFFSRSGLPTSQLAKVWSFSDHTKNGYLDYSAFVLAMELISICQSTGQVSMEALEMAKKTPGGLPAPRMNEPKDSQSGSGTPDEDMPQWLEIKPTDDEKTVAKKRKLQKMDKGIKLMLPTSWNLQPFQLIRHLMGSHSGTPTTKRATSVSDALKKIYFEKIRPIEKTLKFDHFVSPLMNEGDFEGKPSVLLLGQYSTGKSTLIKYLLQREYPGIHIGPEPTTDHFVVVMHGPEERRTPGNMLTVQTDKPYTGLTDLGTGFLSKLEAASCDSPLLEKITFIDTPGILSGEKQRIQRAYDFTKASGWFAARCDLILLLFDPHKLDISDEFKDVIESLKGHDDKVRVVLNKAHQVRNEQELMRVYGALMWSLGKVFKTPEVMRVYIGSFNGTYDSQDDRNPTLTSLFELEQRDLLRDLDAIPSHSNDRRVNEFVKRIRAAKVHSLIIGHLRKQMPIVGQIKAQKRLLENLEAEFRHVEREHHLHGGDFPDVAKYKDILSGFDLSQFPKSYEKLVKQIDDVLSVDIPQLATQMNNPFL